LRPRRGLGSRDAADRTPRPPGRGGVLPPSKAVELTTASLTISPRHSVQDCSRPVMMFDPATHHHRVESAVIHDDVLVARHVLAPARSRDQPHVGSVLEVVADERVVAGPLQEDAGRPGSRSPVGAEQVVKDGDRPGGENWDCAVQIPYNSAPPNGCVPPGCPPFAVAMEFSWTEHTLGQPLRQSRPAPGCRRNWGLGRRRGDDGVALTREPSIKFRWRG
jgi:hypothetical protein